METTHPADTEIVELTADTWQLFEGLLGPSGLQGGCWCAFFRMTGRDFKAASAQERKDHVRDEVERGKPFGLVALLAGQPRGWVAVSPRLDNVRLQRSTIAATSEQDKSDVWSVLCFYTHRDTRGQGVTATLLTEAVRYAAKRGARAIEGYPVETSGAKCSAPDLYHGSLSTFLDAGFRLVERRSTHRALVRIDLA